MEQHIKLARARKRVEAITGFYVHAFVYVLVMTSLFGINLWLSPIWWVQWPILGWGIGLLAQALAVFGGTPSFIRRWQMRKIRDLSEKM